MVVPGVKDEDIPKLFPKGHRVAEMPSGKVRRVAQLISFKTTFEIGAIQNQFKLSFRGFGVCMIGL